ncbi:MAG: 1-acyl-sn-glycerol-3-phosphate acyltransferase [Panacagrimonas sp.]
MTGDSMAPDWGTPFSRALGRGVLRLFGWRLEVHFPPEPRLVIAAAPHTSNWDGFFAVAAILALGVRINWFAKDSLFRWPFRRTLIWLGGVPISRDRSRGVVDQTTDIFAAKERIYIAVAPEGTRARAPIWKSGFWQIASATKVPILTVYLDYGRKVIGTGPLIHPSDDYTSDLARMQTFFRGITSKRPEDFAAEG